MPKNSKIKFLVYIMTFCVRTFMENNISCGMYKKTKKYHVRSHVGASKFILHEAQKIFFSPKTCV
jgi:hypothetical protein